MAERQQIPKSEIKSQSNTPAKMKTFLEKFKLPDGQSTRTQVDVKEVMSTNLS